MGQTEALCLGQDSDSAGDLLGNCTDGHCSRVI